MTTEITALSEQEILALAISLEEEDARIYRDLAEKVRARFPGTASILDSMREEEISHHARLHEFYVRRFGNHVLYLRRQDVKGFLKRRPLWLHPAPNPRQVLRLVMAMEAETRRFYQDAANHAPSEEVRALLTDLADAEEDHQDLLAAETKEKKQPSESK
ncbi:MAG: ferritin family protein [Chthoniobacterales bacterium]